MASNALLRCGSGDREELEMRVGGNDLVRVNVVLIKEDGSEPEYRGSGRRSCLLDFSFTLKIASIIFFNNDQGQCPKSKPH